MHSLGALGLRLQGNAPRKGDALGDERRLQELREREARLRELDENDDEVGWKLKALRADIQAAQSDLDKTIAESRARAKRLEGPPRD